MISDPTVAGLVRTIADDPGNYASWAVLLDRLRELAEGVPDGPVKALRNHQFIDVATYLIPWYHLGDLNEDTLSNYLESSFWVDLHPPGQPLEDVGAVGSARRAAMREAILSIRPPAETRVDVSPEGCVNALLLTDVCMRGPLAQDIPAVEHAVSGWTVDQRNEAFRWACNQHTLASDNEVDVVPCPLHVAVLRNWTS